VGGVVLAPGAGLMVRLRLPGAIPPHESPVPMPGGPVVLVLPARNEAPRIGPVLRRVPELVGGHRVRVIVVDDGSTDGTAAVARDAGAEVVTHLTNLGLGAAVRTGLAAASTQHPSAVAFCDADGEYAPEELDRMVAPILAGAADYVVGSRFAGEIRRMLPHRRAGNRALSVVLAWVARRPITDGQSGYRALAPWAAAGAEIVHDYNYAQVLTLDLLGKGYRYAEVPIRYRFRSTGASFIKLGRYLRRVVPAVYRELNDQSSTTWDSNRRRAAAQAVASNPPGVAARASTAS
jgi:glycosyltransferase involved in cell wall biosynthesis